MKVKSESEVAQSLRSQAQVEGTLGFLLRLEKDLESASKCLESRFPYNDSSAMTRSPSPRAWRPAKEIPGLISFRMDWLHLLAV